MGTCTICCVDAVWGPTSAIDDAEARQHGVHYVKNEPRLALVTGKAPNTDQVLQMSQERYVTDKTYS
jgi:hypothetical protein